MLAAAKIFAAGIVIGSALMASPAVGLLLAAVCALFLILTGKTP